DAIGNAELFPPKKNESDHSSTAIVKRQTGAWGWMIDHPTPEDSYHPTLSLRNLFRSHDPLLGEDQLPSGLFGRGPKARKLPNEKKRGHRKGHKDHGFDPKCVCNAK